MSDTLYELRLSLEHHKQLRDEAVQKIRIAQHQLSAAIDTVVAEEGYILDRMIKISNLQQPMRNYIVSYDFLKDTGLTSEETQVIYAHSTEHARQLFRESNKMTYIRITSIKEQPNVNAN